jgi:hypothetical protein
LPSALVATLDQLLAHYIPLILDEEEPAPATSWAAALAEEVNRAPMLSGGD